MSSRATSGCGFGWQPTPASSTSGSVETAAARANCRRACVRPALRVQNMFEVLSHSVFVQLTDPAAANIGISDVWRVAERVSNGRLGPVVDSGGLGGGLL